MSVLGPDSWAVLLALGWALLHLLWQGVLVGVAHALLRAVLPRSASHARYAAGLGALAVLVLLPVVTFVHLLDGFAPAVTVASAGVLAADGAVQAGPGWALAGGEGSLAVWVVALWLAGVLVVAMRSLNQWCQLQRTLRRWARPDARLAAQLASLARRFDYRGPLRVLVCERIDTPTLIGWLRPVILMPAAIALRFPQAQIEHILAHELGHLCRRDHLFNLLQTLVETLLFYHPVVHWIARQVREDREVCCDLLVLARTGGAPCDYARTLVALEELRQPPVRLALAANGGVLLDRVRRIVGAVPDHRKSVSRRFLLVLVACLVVAVAGFSRLQRQAVVRVQGPDAPRVDLALDMPAAGDLVPAVSARVQLAGNPRIRAPHDDVAAPAPSNLAAGEATPARVAARSPVATVSVPARAPPPPPAAAPPAFAPVAAAREPSPGSASGATSAPGGQPALAAAPATEDVPRLVAVQVVSPEYPFDAHADGAQRVELAFRVRRDGSVRDIEVLSGPRERSFAQAAERALGKWRFEPASAMPGTRYRQAFEFVLPGQQGANADLGCVRKTGSMLCRHAGAPEEETGATVASGSSASARAVGV